jgi:hypothetical protein
MDTGPRRQENGKAQPQHMARQSRKRPRRFFVMLGSKYRTRVKVNNPPAAKVENFTLKVLW